MFIRAGTYELTAPIVDAFHINIRGEGYGYPPTYAGGTILKATVNMPNGIVQYNNSGGSASLTSFSLSWLAICGSVETGLTTKGITVDTCSNFIIEHCVLTRMSNESLTIANCGINWVQYNQFTEQRSLNNEYIVHISNTADYNFIYNDLGTNAPYKNTTNGVYATDGLIHGNKIYITKDAIYSTGGGIISNNEINDFGEWGITVIGSSTIIENNALYYTNTDWWFAEYPYAIYTTSSSNLIGGNKIIDSSDKFYYGIFCANTGDGGGENNTITGNGIYGTTIPIEHQGTGSIIEDNQGFVTENSGTTGEIASGATVNHGLTSTPTSVIVTPTETGLTDIYVSAVGDTTFTINYAGGGTHIFYWYAEYKP